MTAKTVSILTNPHPKSHIVFPYGDEQHIADAVGIYAGAGLAGNESVVLITTAAKRHAIKHRLKADGFDLDQLESTGRLVICEAGNLLSEFLDCESPDPAKFRSVIGRVITEAKASSPTGRVRLYGEMVNLLCGHNNIVAAADLEDLWNEIIDAYSVPLLCSYSTHLLEPHESTGLPQRLMNAHSDIAA